MKLSAALLGLTLLVSPSLLADPPPPGFTCTKNGKAIHCIANDIERFKILPQWFFYLDKGTYISRYDTEFKYHFTSNKWVVLEMVQILNPDDQPADKPDVVLSYSMKTWVRVCGNRAVFARYIKGIAPPNCEKAEE